MRMSTPTHPPPLQKRVHIMEGRKAACTIDRSIPQIVSVSAAQNNIDTDDMMCLR